MTEQSVTAGTVFRWNPRNGTGVIELADGTLAWFHLSTVHGETVATITENMPVEVEIEHIPQGEFTCRATSVRRI